MLRWSTAAATALAWKPLQDHVHDRFSDFLKRRTTRRDPSPSSITVPVDTRRTDLIAAPDTPSPAETTQEPSNRTMLQLNPMIPLWHVASGQACHAFMALDYSQEHDLMFSVILQNGEIWVCRASELRGQENLTLGRRKQADDKSLKTASFDES